MTKNISNVKYELIKSTDSKFKEVQVLFTYQGQTEKYFVFIEDEGKKNYIREAKRIFKRDLNNGKVAQALKINPNSTNRNPILITSIAVVAAAAVAVGGVLIYQHFNSTSGGGSYKPGQEVQVIPEINDPSGDYRVTFNNTKAVVGEEFNTTIDLIPQNASTKSYYLPDKLVSVVSNTTILKEDQYTYTLDTTTKTSATLKVPAENVYGPIIVNLALVESGDDPKPGDIVDVIADVTDPSGAYKVTYNDKDTPAHAIVGKVYTTTIKLTKVGVSDDDYTLPEKLSTVISGSSILKADEGYTYTLDETKMSATLLIPAAYVKGKTLIDIDLAIVEPLPVITGDPREPLTFISNVNNGEISIHYKKCDWDSNGERVPERPNGINLEYQVDNGDWKTVEGLEQKIEEAGEESYDLTIETGLKKGHAIRFRGDNNYWSYSGDIYQTCYESMTFVTKGSFVVANNVMSLLDKDTFINEKDLTDKSGCFLYLFGSENNKINDASGLCLPATTLAQNAYACMFKDCKDLIYSPLELPAETLPRNCYDSMFNGCSSLIKGPFQIGSATGEAGRECCSNMFNGCANLAEAPLLPSTNLIGQCYQYMFSYCSSLKVAPYLPANNDQLKIDDDWITGCYDYIFEGCSKLEYVQVGFANDGDLWPGATPDTSNWDYLFTNGWLRETGKDAATKTFAWKGITQGITFERIDSTLPNGWTITNPS